MTALHPAAGLLFQPLSVALHPRPDKDQITVDEQKPMTLLFTSLLLPPYKMFQSALRRASDLPAACSPVLIAHPSLER